MNSEQYYVDLAAAPPDEILRDLGIVYLMFGRIDYMVLIAIKRLRNITLAEAQALYNHYTLGARLFGKKPCDIGKE